MAAPYDGELFTFLNPDDTEIVVRGWGNQYDAIFESTEGYTVVKDPESGFFHYATLSDDETQLVPSGQRVGQVSPDTLDVPGSIRPRRVRPRRPGAEGRSVAAESAFPGETRWMQRRAEARERARQRDEVLDLEGGDRNQLVLAPPGRATVGTYVGLCLLIDFSDQEATIPRTGVENFCNQAGYNGFGNNGSVHDYFKDVSDGRLLYTNVVTSYYRAAHPRSYYTDRSQPYGSRARELITEALDDLVANNFDFSSLTADSGNYIYALNVYYAGTRVNNWSEGLWPHASTLASAYPVAGGKRFADYQITDMTEQLTLRTFCHENGHMICDFPDLYDYGGESSGPGHFCLMGYGGSGKNPTEVGAYLKYAAGWAGRAELVNSGQTYALRSGRNEFCLHRKNRTEYFIIENRRRVGRDASLPAQGLAVWHVDELGSNNNEQRTPLMHYECSLEQADGRFDLEGRANYGDADDLFIGPLRFDDATGPSARWWDGSNSGLVIDSISAAGPTMTFTAGGGSSTSGDALGAIYGLLLS